MKILTLDNKVFDTDTIGHEITEDIHFCVLEYGNEKNTDFYMKPLLFLETFSDIRLEMKIGDYNFRMPKDWSILCIDKEMGDGEVISPKMPRI